MKMCSVVKLLPKAIKSILSRLRFFQGKKEKSIGKNKQPRRSKLFAVDLRKNNEEARSRYFLLDLSSQSVSLYLR